jgi:restriction system protein
VTLDAPIPSYYDLLWPTLQAVREIGDSGEIVEKVTEREGFTEAQQSVPHGDGPSSEIEYRLAWARTYLKGMGALINSARGVWSTTERGRRVRSDQIPGLHAEYVGRLRTARKAKNQATSESPDGASFGRS